MKKIVFAFLVVLFGSINSLTAQGIEFNHSSLEEALQKAKKEGKLVFVDFYTAWCAPCKMMSRDVFVLPEVGEVYNKEFISIKLDAEKEGSAAAKKYNVSSYPTFLFLTSDGKVALKDVGSMSIKDFIAKGKNAVASITSNFSLKKLKEDFPNKQKDEHFLKLYIDKIQEYGQSPSEGIDAWLKVQTQIKENSPEMLGFLLKNSRFLLVDSRAEDILSKNYDEYKRIAVKNQALMLEMLKRSLVFNTKKVASKTNNPKLMRAFIDHWKRLPQKLKKGSLTEYEMEYAFMNKDSKGYKALAVKFIDSIKNNKSISEIKEKDKTSYKNFKKTYDANPNESTEMMLNVAKEGLVATKIIKVIASTGDDFLSVSSGKTDYKTIKSWLDYGYKLQANSCFLDNLYADMLYKQGKVKQALEVKKRAYDNWPTTDKKRVVKAHELEKMAKGENFN